ncbi:CPBP family intramembrane metalloprotease (plasmid) [Agrobacterium sp. MA01]|uniref:CPBP family intramembrane glutamic endopeptidase n=1 Tax=Agrobacterium sp. MA01 TaxID=2664893 RepID=UPI00129BFDD6|nr:type II CAAX endopeptidase family protein [Agrobacterium sp. MA01]QGG93437.1 CPBP family intramembrane metalloprotease [Agrobacterium sp. MA01]
MHEWKSLARPTWAELGVGITCFQFVLVLVALAVGGLASGEPVWQGVIGSYGGGVAGLVGFAVAYLMRRREWSAYGITSSGLHWFAIAAALAVFGYVISLIFLYGLAELSGSSGNDPQAILHAATRGGVLPFVLSFAGGAMLTPLGEELLFRGVIANALNRYGAWAGVGLSSLIFGIAHGVGVILPIAIFMGLMCGILFRMSGSVWPCVVLHAIYNGLHSVGSALSG